MLGDVLDRARPDHRVAEAVKPQRRRRQPLVVVRAAHPRGELLRDERAIQLRRRLRALLVGEAWRVRAELAQDGVGLRRDRLVDRLQHARRRAHPATDERGAEQSLVDDPAELLGEGLQRHRRPHVAGVDRHEALDAVGVVEAHEEADDPAPVVADEVHPVDAQLVEHAGDIVGELVLAIAARRRLAPAEAPQVKGHHAEVGGQQWHDGLPRPPALRPAVHEQHGRAGAHLGDVQLRAAHVDVAVLDALELGEVGVIHRPRAYPGSAESLWPLQSGTMNS